MLLGSRPLTAILPATNIERARQFYADKLGLRVLETQTNGGEESLRLGAGDCTQLYIYRRAEPTRAEHTVAGFEVENIEQTVRELRDKGVRMEQYDMPGLKTDSQGIAAVDSIKSAWFKDSEGNILAITEGMSGQS